MKFIKYPDREQWEALCLRPEYDQDRVKEIIKPIIKKVKEKGDKALRKLILEYDHIAMDSLIVNPEEFRNARRQVSTELKNAIHQAISNITKFHKAQKTRDIKISPIPGVKLMRKALPINSVGLYIPGGTAPLFSTVLMLGVPAKLAGCSTIVMCTPCDLKGDINPYGVVIS